MTSAIVRNPSAKSCRLLFLSESKNVSEAD
jgi:hypothetical protein